MIKIHYYFFAKLRTAIAMVLLLFISIKIAGIAVTMAADTRKEIFVDTNESKVKTTLENGKEFIGLSHHYTRYLVITVAVIHYTAYNINYCSSYYNSIIIPPPKNLHLQISA